MDRETVREIERIDQAILKGDTRVIGEYGSLQAALKRSVALEKRARGETGRGLVGRGETWETRRLAGTRYW